MRLDTKPRRDHTDMPPRILELHLDCFAYG